MGFAGAFTAQANDPSAIFHNAAGIAFLKGKQFYIGGTLIHPSTTFTGADPFPGASVTEGGRHQPPSCRRPRITRNPSASASSSVSACTRRSA